MIPGRLPRRRISPAKIGGRRSAATTLFLCALIGSVWSSSASSANAPSPPAIVEFWVIEPNEGQSSGGHAAIRIDEWVYHVEHRGDGLIADRRTPRRGFEDGYRLRENRGIQAISLALSPEERVSLETAFKARYFERKGRLDRLDALDAEARWLADAARRGSFLIEIPGLGLYEAGQGRSCNRDEGAGQYAVQEALATRYGSSWLAARLQDAKNQARSLLLARLDHGSDSLGRESLPQPPSARGHGHGGAHRRLVEAAQTWAALEVLARCQSLRAGRLQTIEAATGPAPNPKLLEARRARWTEIRDELTARLVELVASERPDVGLSILLAWARLEAIDRSIESGRLHVLEPRQPAHDLGPASEGDLPEAWITEHREQVRKQWMRSTREFESGSGPLEARFVGLERGHHAYQHLRRGTLHSPLETSLGNERTISLSASVAVHYASERWLLPWPERQGHAALLRASEKARKRARAERRRVRDEMRYRLFTQNCVTELLSLLSPRSVPSRTPPSLWAGHFIPAAAGGFLENTLAATPSRSLPSAREQRLAQARVRNPWSGLREHITLTSQQYAPHPADSAFLFFTDGPFWTRPFVGLANLGYGLGTAGLGVFAAPFDRGTRLRQGMQGMVMSVPELFLFRVRRGTYLVTDPMQNLDGRAQPAP